MKKIKQMLAILEDVTCDYLNINKNYFILYNTKDVRIGEAKKFFIYIAIKILDIPEMFVNNYLCMSERDNNYYKYLIIGFVRTIKKNDQVKEDLKAINKRFDELYSVHKEHSIGTILLKADILNKQN